MSKAHLPSSPLTIGNGSGHSFCADLHRAAVTLAIERDLLCGPLPDRRERVGGVLVGLELCRVETEHVCDCIRTFRLQRFAEGVECCLRRVEDRRIDVRRKRLDFGGSDIRRPAASCAEATDESDKARPKAMAVAQTLRESFVANTLVIVLSSRSVNAVHHRHAHRRRAHRHRARRRVRRRRWRLTCLWPPPPRWPPPIDWWPRLDFTLVALPRSTLPTPEGFFGRLSALAAGLGLPALRFTLAVPAGRAVAGGRPGVGPAGVRPVGRPVRSLTALGLQPVERAFANVSCPGSLAGHPVGDLVALLDIAGAVANCVVAIALEIVLDVRAIELCSWSRSMLILLRSTFFQSTSLKSTLPLKSRLLKQSLQSMSMSPPSQLPPHTPQSSQSTAAAQIAPVAAAAKKVAVG